VAPRLRAGARGYDSKTAERRNYWSELAIWSTRRLGELIAEGQKRGEIAKSAGRPKKNGDIVSPLTLAEALKTSPEQANTTLSVA
jgi:hypothetical protein